MEHCCWVNLDDKGEDSVQRKLPKFTFARLQAERLKACWLRLSYAECSLSVERSFTSTSDLSLPVSRVSGCFLSPVSIIQLVADVKTKRQ